MNKVTTINLNGRAYQLEERGFDALRRYLDTAAAKLADNPDKDEIMADFEQAIADKFDQKLSPGPAGKNVVTEKEVEDIIAAMGPVEGAGAADTDKENAASAAAGSDEKKSRGAGGNGTANGPASNTAKAGPRRLYRLPGTEWIMGVCAGLAAYFNIDVTLMRVIWILLTIFTHGFWILAYIVLAVVMPPAKTEEEYAQVYGWSAHPPFNAHDFIEEAKKRYAELQKMHEEHKAKMAAGADSVAAASGAAASATAGASTVKEDINEWKRDFKQEMRAKKQKMKQEWRAQQRQWHDARRQGPDWRYYNQNHTDVSPNDAYNERRYGAGYGISRAIFGFFAVLVSMVLLAVGVAFVVSLVSLIKFGTVFGYALGAGQPLWIPIVFLTAAFYIIAAPFRMLIQHAWGNARYQSGWADFGRGVIFLAVLALLAYTARDLFPSVNAAYDTALGWLAARR